MRNKPKVIKNMLIGMIGICICMAATWLSSAYGKGNVRNGFIQSNWPKMSYIRFEISLILSALGIPLYYIGAKDYIKAVRVSVRKRYIMDRRMAKIFEVGIVAGVISYLFIQVSYIMMALVYKLLFTTNLMGADLIATTEGMFYYIAIPLFAYIVIAIGAVSVAYMYFVYIGRIKVPKFCIIFNPLIFLGIGQLIKLTKIHYLVDFASAFTLMGFLFMMAAGAVHVSKIPVRKKNVEE